MFVLVVMEGMTLSGHLPNINEIYICIQAMLLTHPYGLVVMIWPTQEIGLGQQASNKLKIMKFNALFCQLIKSQLFFEIEERFMLIYPQKKYQLI